MYFARSFVGNLYNRDTGNAEKLTEILEIPWGDNGYGTFAPDMPILTTYRFTFRR
jgi:hypothetical protein